MDVHLPQYRHLHRQITEPFAVRSELQIVAECGDEIAQFSADLVINAEVPCHQQIEVLAICVNSSDGKQIKWGPPEITALQLKDPKDGTLRIIRCDDSATIWFEPAEGWAPKKGIHFTCLVWEAMRSPQGIEPYVYSELTARISLPPNCNQKLVLTLNTPEKASPRSTQGSFLLAYPSRAQQQRRQTLVYFSHAAPADLRYRFSKVESADLPWPVLFKSLLALAVVAVLAWVPNVLAPGADQTRNILLLLTAIASYAVYINDLVAQGLRVQIYKTTSGGLTLVALASGFVVTAMYGWIIYIFLTAQTVAGSSPAPGFVIPTGVPLYVRIAMLVAMAVTMIVFVAGMYAHTIGVWQGFRCDISNCNHRLLIRRGRRECKYTGRVPCKRCIKVTCAACPHFADLRSGRLDTAHLYCPSALPCVQELRVAGDRC